jgi:queuine tRNA-ribosyltransferase
MVLDECTPWPVEEAAAAKSMRLSMRWAARCRNAFHAPPGYALFGIVQGSIYPALRAESAAALKALGFDGYAVGGLAVGEGQAAMLATLEATVPHLPADRPRYLMGVGKPDDLVAAVIRGIDMFDCVLPTRSGRTGQAFTRQGALNIRNARHGGDERPLDPDCHCPACRQFSRAYLHHLVKAGEILGAMLLTWHNLVYYQDLMATLRIAIEEARLAQAAASLRAAWVAKAIAPN